MKPLRRFLGGPLFVGAISATSRAYAEPSPANTAAFAAGFADAKALVAQGHFAEACPKFDEAQRRYPTAGTFLNLGDCYELSTPPRTASAWGAFKQAVVTARNAGDTGR